MKALRPLLLAGITVLLFALSPWTAEADLVPGTQLSLVPPEGFTPADRFPGFQRSDLQASIMVTELPAPVVEMKKAMTKENLATRGMDLLSSETRQVEGKEGLLLHVSQRAGEVEYLKWMLVAGEATSTVMIVGTFPKSAAAEVSEAIKASVLTVSWTAASRADAFEGLSFRLAPSPMLKLAGRVSNMVLLSESGKTGPLAPGEPVFVAGSSISDVPIEDLRAFAEARLKKTEQAEGFANLRGRAMDLDGLEAYELVADAKDVKTDAALLIYQVIAREGKGYLIIQGHVGAARGDELLEEFRRVASTFKRAGE